MIALAFLVFCAPVCAQTRVWMQSDPGDNVGRGGTFTFSTPAVTFNPTALQHALQLDFNGWTIILWGPIGTRLAPGAYERTPWLQDSGNGPALEVGNNGQGCNGPLGRFAVLDVAFGADGNISSLAADFEYHCHGVAAALWGEVRFNSAVAFTFERAPGWSTPDAFAFAPVTLAAISGTAISDATTIYGINAPAPISIVNGEYSVNGGDFTSGPGFVSNRDRVVVGHFTASTPNASTTTILTVGTVSATFTSTTYGPGEPQTGLVVESFPGDIVGEGLSYFYHPPDWSIQSTMASAVAVVGHAAGALDFNLSLKGPSGAPLAPGAYEDASIYAASGVSPGLSFGFQLGCDEVAGRFTILELDSAATPPKLAVDFEQWCDSSSAPLFGELRFNSTIPFNFQVTSPRPQPEAMAFAPKSVVRAGSMQYSSYTRIYGTNTPVPISIIGGEYSVNGGAFTAAPGFVNELDAIQLRAKAATVPGMTRQVLLQTAGTVTPFSVQTYSPGSAVNGLFFRGTGSDFVTGGQTLFAPGPPTRVRATNDTALGGIRLNFDTPGGFSYMAMFASPTRGVLTPGVYEGATRFPFEAVGTPGLDFSGSGGCNQESGRFVVHEAVYDGAGNIQRFAADFEVHCELVEPPVYGQVRFNSLIPLGKYVSSLPARDLNGDATDDIIWKHDDGRVAVWNMNALTPIGSAEILGPGSGWNPAHAGDLDGDGRADIVWEHPDGRMAVWLMNGTVPVVTSQLLNAGSGWSVSHVADLDGDGKSDLVFRNLDGSVAVWTMNGTAVTSGATILPAATGWSVSATADFDGDGKADLLWTHSDGRVAIWLMNGTAVKSASQILNAGTGWSPAHVADLDGNGKADIVWRNADGRIALWLMDGATLVAGGDIMGAGTGWRVAFTGDFNGDGKADLLFENDDGRAALWIMEGLKPTSMSQLLNAGSGWSVANVEDLDGDGLADIVWKHTDGRVAAWLMFGTAVQEGSGLLGAGTHWSVVAP
jgi:FG-GAP-like repeat